MICNNFIFASIYNLMKQPYSSKMVFIGKSLLWSVLFYITITVALDWQELMQHLKNEQPVALVKKTEQPADVSPKAVMYSMKIMNLCNALWQQLSMQGRF